MAYARNMPSDMDQAYDPDTIKPSGNVYIYIDGINKQIELLGAEIIGLESQIDPVLKPEMSDPEVADNIRRASIDSQSNMANSLQSLMERLHYTTQKVQTLRARVDL